MECEEESGSCDGFLDCALEANKQEETFMQNGHTKNVLSMFPLLFCIVFECVDFDLNEEIVYLELENPH